MKAIERTNPTFDYQIEDKPKAEAKLTTAREHRKFGEDGYFYFEGSRGELQDFIKASNPELYNKAFVHTVNGMTRDWFSATSAEAIRSLLETYGFNWKVIYKTVVAEDSKKNSGNLDENC